jgi:hypothetical protein
MHRLPNIDLAVPITGKVCGFEQTHRDTRRKQFAMPRPVILVRHQAGVLALQHSSDTFLHSLNKAASNRAPPWSCVAPGRLDFSGLDFPDDVPEVTAKSESGRYCLAKRRGPLFVTVPNSPRDVMSVVPVSGVPLTLPLNVSCIDPPSRN